MLQNARKASPCSAVQILAVMRETWVPALGWESSSIVYRVGESFHISSSAAAVPPKKPEQVEVKISKPDLEDTRGTAERRKAT